MSVRKLKHAGGRPKIITVSADEVLLLHDAGASFRAIARELGCGRDSVQRLLRQAQDARAARESAERCTQLLAELQAQIDSQAQWTIKPVPSPAIDPWGKPSGLRVDSDGRRRSDW